MRRDVDVTDTTFPYLSPTTAYVLVSDDGDVFQVSPSAEIVREVKSGKARLFAVWPGQWRSDVFTIDPDALLVVLQAHAEMVEEDRRAAAIRNARMAEERRNRPKQQCPRCGKELRVRDDGSLYPHNDERYRITCNGGSAGEMAAIQREREAAERRRAEREQWERETAERRVQHDAEYKRLNSEFQAGRLEGHAKADGSLCGNSLTVRGGPRCSMHEAGVGEVEQYEAKLDALVALRGVAP